VCVCRARVCACAGLSVWNYVVTRILYFIISFRLWSTSTFRNHTWDRKFTPFQPRPRPGKAPKDIRFRIGFNSEFALRGRISGFSIPLLLRASRFLAATFAIAAAAARFDRVSLLVTVQVLCVSIINPIRFFYLTFLLESAQFF